MFRVEFRRVVRARVLGVEIRSWILAHKVEAVNWTLFAPRLGFAYQIVQSKSQGRDRFEDVAKREMATVSGIDTWWYGPIV